MGNVSGSAASVSDVSVSNKVIWFIKKSPAPRPDLPNRAPPAAAHAVMPAGYKIAQPQNRCNTGIFRGPVTRFDAGDPPGVNTVTAENRIRSPEGPPCIGPLFIMMIGESL